MEHALRMTLVADSLSLQFRLPAPGLAQPIARSSAAIAGGVPVVDAVVLTSVWTVSVLRSLSLVRAALLCVPEAVRSCCLCLQVCWGGRGGRGWGERVTAWACGTHVCRAG